MQETDVLTSVNVFQKIIEIMSIAGKMQELEKMFHMYIVK